jgi:TPR repeat protein
MKLSADQRNDPIAQINYGIILEQQGDVRSLSFTAHYVKLVRFSSLAADQGYAKGQVNYTRFRAQGVSPTAPQ